MARNEQLIRQHKLLEVLEARRYGITLGELRDELVSGLGLTSLSPRTVRRDLAALQSAGFDIGSQTQGERTVWKLGPHSRKKLQIQATATELLALSLGRELLLPLAGTPFGQGIESFWQRVRKDLPESVWQHYQKYRRVLRVLGIPAKTYEQQQGTIKTINRAILEHRIIRAEYRSLGKPGRERRIAPYAMALWQGSLYVIGADTELDSHDPSPIRHWKIDRFGKVAALDQWFGIPDDFDLDEFLAGSVGVFAGGELTTYRIWISASAAPWISEDPWHPEQQIERQADDSVIVTLAASHAMAVLPRVLALGSQARLLEPAEARRQIQEILSAALAGYDQP